MLLPLSQANLKGRRVLLRVDYNINLNALGEDYRIKQTKETLAYILKQKPQYVILLTHLGRPHKYDSKVSFQKLVPLISKTLKQKIHFLAFVSDLKTVSIEDNHNQVYLLDNLRFWPGENKNDSIFAKKLSLLGDVMVNEAFSVSHRQASSVSAIKKYLPSYAGLRLAKETEELSRFLKFKAKPFLILLGGAKIAEKTEILKAFSAKADAILLGGGPANTVMKALGFPIGQSIEEPLTPEGKALLLNKKIILPIDWTIIRKNKTLTVSPNQIKPQDFIIDIGPQTAKLYAFLLSRAHKIFFNGPLGKRQLSYSQPIRTKEVISAIKKSTYAIAGGGDTVALIEQLKLQKYFKFLSTAGGAALSYLAKKPMPGLD